MGREGRGGGKVGRERCEEGEWGGRGGVRRESWEGEV